MKIDPRSLDKLMAFEDEGSTRQKVIHPKREAREQYRKRDHKAAARRKQEQRYS